MYRFYERKRRINFLLSFFSFLQISTLENRITYKTSRYLEIYKRPLIRKRIAYGSNGELRKGDSIDQGAHRLSRSEVGRAVIAELSTFFERRLIDVAYQGTPWITLPATSWNNRRLLFGGASARRRAREWKSMSRLRDSDTRPPPPRRFSFGTDRIAHVESWSLVSYWSHESP